VRIIDRKERDAARLQAAEEVHIPRQPVQLRDTGDSFFGLRMLDRWAASAG
jgi:hypothetical protein